MQVERGIENRIVERLYEEGRWDELADVYHQILDKDETDARTAFALANLLACQGVYDKACDYYDIAKVHGWRQSLCSNNRGVVLAWLGEARASFEDLLAARRDPECAPAAYNLGILAEHFMAEGRFPTELERLALPTADPWKLAQECYRAVKQEPEPRESESPGPEPSTRDATHGGDIAETEEAPGEDAPAERKIDWGPARGFDRPLFLWKEDVPPGFGFEQRTRRINVQQATELFRRGREALDRGEWQESIQRFESALRLQPSLEARIEPLKTRALVKDSQERLSRIMEMWDADEREEARHGLEALFTRLPELPAEALAEDILADAIRQLMERIGEHQPGMDWETLQKLFTLVRQNLEKLEFTRSEPAGHEPTSGETEASAPPVEDAGEEEARPREPSEEATSSGVRLRDQVRQVCREACKRQIDFLIEEDQVDMALEFLDFVEHQWFVLPEDLTTWRRGIYIAQAEKLYARGKDVARKTDPKNAEKLWKEGLEAARKSGDPDFVELFETKIDRLTRKSVPQEILVEINRKLDRGEYREALRQTQRELEEYVGDEELSSYRDTAVDRLLRRAERAFRAGSGEQAWEIVEQLLESVPGERRAKDLLEEIDEEWIRRVAAQPNPRVPTKTLATLQTKLEAGRYREVLSGANDELDRHPGDRRLKTLREVAAGRLLERAEGALEIGHRDKAQQLLKEVLAVVPENQRARNLLSGTRTELLGQRLAEAENLRLGGQIEEAQRKCRQALEIDPGNEEARKLRAQLERASWVDPGKRVSVFEEALVAFEEARSNADPEAAFPQVLRLRELRPEAPESEEALQWILREGVAALRRGLEEDRSTDTAKTLLQKIESLIGLCPSFVPALELREELRQVAEPYRGERRRRSVKELGKAQQALLDRDSIQALKAVEAVLELGDENLRPDAEDVRKRAEDLLRRNIKRLERQSDKQAEIKRLLAEADDWAPEFVRAKREKLRDPEEKSRDERMGKLEQLLRDPEDGRVQALRAFDDAVRAGELAAGLLTARRPQILALRRRLRGVMTPAERWRVWLHEKWNRVDALYGTDEPSPSADQEKAS